MKILTFINLMQKLTRTQRIFIRASNYGVNPLTHVKPVFVVKELHNMDPQVYGRYRYATAMDKNPEEGIELIFKED